MFKIIEQAREHEDDEWSTAFWWCDGTNEGGLRFNRDGEVDAYSLDNLRQVLVMANNGCSFYADAVLAIEAHDVESRLEAAGEVAKLVLSGELPEMREG